MRCINCILLITALVLSSCNNRNDNLIIACGWDEVYISDISMDVPEKVWSWKAENADSLPHTMRNKFLTTDECKPVNKSKDILISSSGGGVALVNIESSKVKFWASVPNAHSAELLPDGRLVVAASISPMGNRLNLYNIEESGMPVFSDSLYSAHGVLWDGKRKLLWALGYDLLNSYSLKDWDTDSPSLQLSASYKLPDNGGHDLVFVNSKNDICLTTEMNVWIFDPENERFSKHPSLGDEPGVKSVSYNRRNSQTAYMKSADNQWWGYYIRFADSDNVVYLPYEKLYKVRWLY